MPTQQEHLDQSNHNRAFFESFDISTTSFRDWVVTGVYYCALHYLEAYLAIYDEHPNDNMDREECFAEYGELDVVYEKFTNLKTYSQNARYECFDYSAGTVQNMIDEDLSELKEGIDSILP